MRPALVLLSVFAIACKSDPEKAPTAPGPPGSIASVTTKATAPSASAPAPKRPRPVRTKAYGNPLANTLGDLPDGVGLAPGTQVPDVTVHDAEGKEIRLASLYAKGDILLVFYRGGWCPYCNFQIRELAKLEQQFERRNITPVIVSADRPAEASRTRQAHGPGFPVLSDPELDLHEAFNVVAEVDDATYEKLKAREMDLEAYSGKKHHRIAVPSVFWIDTTGTVRFSHAERDHKIRPSALQLIRVIDETKKGARPAAAPSSKPARPAPSAKPATSPAKQPKPSGSAN